MHQRMKMDSTSDTKISLCTDKDIPPAFEAMSKGFGQGNAPFLDAYFPKHWTAEGRKKGTARLLAWKQAAPTSQFLKATLDSTIIGLAIWTHMASPPPQTLEEADNVEEAWPNEDDREYMRRLWRRYVVPRTAAVLESGEKGIMVLELLAVDANFQQRGSGSALVRWGTRIADERGIAAVIEATPEGQRTYEKCGFHVSHEMELDVGKEFEGRKKPRLFFMTRAAKTTE